MPILCSIAYQKQNLMTDRADNSFASGYVGRMVQIIEQALEIAGHGDSRESKDKTIWMLNRGSAKVDLVFHPKRGLIYADAYLATIPIGDGTEIFKYLLCENLFLNDISLGIKDNHIIISFLTNDRDLSPLYLSKMLKKLLIAADKYDNILVEKFNALWPQ